jgi:hypothetical protein
MPKNRREVNYGEDSPDIILPQKDTPEMGESPDEPEIHPDIPEVAPGLQEIVEIEEKEKEIPKISPEEIQKIIDHIEDEEDPNRDALIEKIIQEIKDQRKPEEPTLH